MNLGDAETLREKARKLEFLVNVLKTVANMKSLDILNVDNFNESLDLCKLSK